MLRATKEMQGYVIEATDGEIGRVRDFYFDDEAWVVRYLVVETGAWLSRRNVLLSPTVIRQSNWIDKVLRVSLTQAEVKASPDIDTDKPVSLQHEREPSSGSGYSSTQCGTMLCGGFFPTGIMVTSPTYERCTPDVDNEQARAARAEVESYVSRHSHDNPHLRSGNSIAEYFAHASDGDIGHIQGLLVDDRTWAIRYMIVNTSKWWLGHEVLISPEWIENIDWAESKVMIDLTRESIRGSPAYDSATPLTREMELGIYRHYRREAYWPWEAGYEEESRL